MNVIAGQVTRRMKAMATVAIVSLSYQCSAVAQDSHTRLAGTVLAVTGRAHSKAATNA